MDTVLGVTPLLTFLLVLVFVDTDEKADLAPKPGGGDGREGVAVVRGVAVEEGGRVRKESDSVW